MRARHATLQLCASRSLRSLPLILAQRRCMHSGSSSSRGRDDWQDTHQRTTPTSARAQETSASTRVSAAASSASPGTPANSLQADDAVSWLDPLLQRAVAEGRQSQASADYFRSIVYDEPDLRSGVVEARRLIGGQDPEKLTRYQQGQFADRLTNFVSRVASEKLQQVHAEEQNTKRFTQEGTPTGENYWLEAGNTLVSPAVPGFVKDEILHDMQESRSARSPAYDQPAEEAELAAQDDGYAAHLRRQRSKLLRDVEFK